MELSTDVAARSRSEQPSFQRDPEDRHHDHGDSDRRIEAQPPSDKVVHGERPEHVDLAVGELEDAHDAQDQREAQGHQYVEPAEGYPVDCCLQPKIKRVQPGSFGGIKGRPVIQLLARSQPPGPFWTGLP